jgi:two-component system sensor histidine kinase BarA
MSSGISLANKCQLLFGAAIVLILIGALAVPWARTQSLVRESQLEVARQLAEAWLHDRMQLGVIDAAAVRPEDLESFVKPRAGQPLLRLTLVRVENIDSDAEPRSFASRALEHFRENATSSEYSTSTRVEGVPVYRYARPMRESQMRAIQDRTLTSFVRGAFEPGVADPIQAVLVIDRTSPFAEGQLLTSRVFIIAAGIVGAILAGLVFHFILTKLILSPVRTLRGTAERVQAGDLRTRASIRTGDEFEQLSSAFNTMLDRLEQGQSQLKSLNETLDFKVSELAEANVGLFESNKLKSEFLANVSHELRTPLNSIIGFAELLEEIARSEVEPNPKRVRYISNILTSGKSLLEMINDLLNMAKIESGRMEVNIEPTNVGDLIDGLSGLMRPAAENKQITLRTVVGQRLPAIETDPGKLQQILYNFLANAIKFTPVGGTVSISADRVTRQDNSAGVRVAVADSGPGIPFDMQDVIFEKFRQVDASHTRQHEGTGLGLAICKELAQLLGATVSFVSEPGRGATFFVDLPLTHQPHAPQPLMATTPGGSS